MIICIKNVIFYSKLIKNIYFCLVKNTGIYFSYDKQEFIRLKIIPDCICFSLSEWREI